MKVALDGVIYQLQSTGGVSRIYTEILPRMCHFEPDLHLSLFVSRPYRQDFPQHSCINLRRLTRRDLRPARLWRGLRPYTDRILYAIHLSKDTIWHSTYFTLPHTRVRAVVTTFYDSSYQHFASTYSQPGEEKLRHQQKESLLAADTIICISQTTAKQLKQYFDIAPDKIRIIPLGCSPVFRRQEIELNGRPFLLYVGNRHGRKNFAGFLNGYAEWPRRAEADLVVVGHDWSPDERQMIEQAGVASQVALRTGVDDKQLSRLYNQAAAVVYPSLWEGFGLPVIEAMACGCPVVASRIPSTVEVAGDFPYYFDTAELDSLHVALDQALSEGRGSPRAAEACRHAQSYSWDSTARQTYAVYRSLM
jgi:glycosyltransferase involved in cell wall biosynthesis